MTAKSAALYNKVSSPQFDSGLELIEMLSITPGSDILDIGSGTGNLTFELAKKAGPKGSVFAIEPDSSRVEVSKSECPKGLDNITWFEGNLSRFSEANRKEYDFAYSNYVLHWIENQQQAVQLIYNTLRPGSKFAFCTCFAWPEVLYDLCNAVSGGDKVMSSFHFTPEDEWRRYFEEAGFTIVEERKVPNVIYRDIHELMQWWEATTHGVFSVAKIPEDTKKHLIEKYVGSISFFRDGNIRLVAQK